MGKGNYMELKRISFLLCVCVFCSCCFGVKDKEKGCLVEERVPMSDKEQYFIPNDDGYMYIVYGDMLQRLYENRYYNDYRDYTTFKEIVVEGTSIDFSTSIDGKKFDYFDERFVLDKSVMDYYIKNGVKALKEQYCQYRNGRLEFTKRIPFEKRDSRMTVAYCLWKNGFTFYYGGLSGEDFFLE